MLTGLVSSSSSLNGATTALRRHELVCICDMVPMTSVRHCGSHFENLIECATLESHDYADGTFTICSTTASFLKMGPNFLRLIQSVPFEMEEHMPPPTVGHPPPGAEAIADELQDYFVRN